MVWTPGAVYRKPAGPLPQGKLTLAGVYIAPQYATLHIADTTPAAAPSDTVL
jgi:hypothetical protein